MRATAASVADITQLPDLMHGQERELFSDQAYWKEDDREFLEAWGVRYLECRIHAENLSRMETLTVPVRIRIREVSTYEMACAMVEALVGR